MRRFAARVLALACVSALVTGSYNFTFSAQARNAENLLILRGNAPLSGVYLDNWRRHQADALPYAEVIR